MICSTHIIKLYRASPSLGAKNIINLILVLTIWWCPCVESSLVLLEEDGCYDQCVLLAKLFALLHFVLQGQIACYSRCFLNSYFYIPTPIMKRTSFLGVSSKRSCRSSSDQIRQVSCSVMSDSLQPHESQHARPPCPSPTPRVHWLTSIESVMPSSHLILYCPLLLLPPIPPSIRVFSNESTLRMRWPKYWSFSCSIIPSKEIPGLTSFRMVRLDLLAVQAILKSLLQHHTSKASILQCSAFFTIHLSHPYMTTGKTIALTRRIFVGQVMSPFVNMLSRLVITFLPSSKHLLI